MEALAFEQLERLEREHWWFRGRRRVYLGLIEALLEGRRPARALDVGAGVGGFVEGLARLCDEVVALDLDPRGLAACRARGARAALRAQGDALPFGDASFELVCLFDVLEHADDDAAVLAEVARVLAPGGLAFLSVPAWPFLYAENDRVAHHRRRYRRAPLARRVRAAGLEVVRNTHSNALLFGGIVPAVLSAKAWQALGGGRGSTNLSWSPPGWLDALCYRAFTAELPLALRADLPLGHSIALAARRPAAGAGPAGEASPRPPGGRGA